MTTTKARKIAKLIIELAENDDVSNEMLEGEVYAIVNSVPEDYANEIIHDLETLNA
jgi:hypothetical protein